MGLRSEPHEPCLFLWINGDQMLLLLIYVDDMIADSNCKHKLAEVKTKLKETFEIKDMGEPEEFLGIFIKRNKEKGIMTLSQLAYIEKILHRFGYASEHPQRTPMVTNQVANRERKMQVQENDDETLRKTATKEN